MNLNPEDDGDGAMSAAPEVAPAGLDYGRDFAPDASAVCDDCGEDLMGGGPHGAGCPAAECEACGHSGGREARLGAYTDRCECGCHWPQEA